MVESSSHLILRAELAAIDKSDRPALYQFFKRHQFLTIHDLAVATGLSYQLLIRYRRTAGITAGRPIGAGPIAWLPLPEIVPEHWATDREWLLEMVQKYGTRQIARLTGCTLRRVQLVLKRNKVVLPKRQTNPFRTKEWVEKVYVKSKYPIHKCAKLAGVSRHTFRSWIVRFGFQLRTPGVSFIIDDPLETGCPILESHGHSPTS